MHTTAVAIGAEKIECSTQLHTGLTVGSHDCPDARLALGSYVMYMMLRAHGLLTINFGDTMHAGVSFCSKLE